MRLPLSAVIAACAALALLAGGAFAGPKGKKKAKKDPYEESKYKSYKVLVDEDRTYRFDARGNPIPPPSKKKPSNKKKGKASSDGDSGKSCESGEACEGSSEKAEEGPKED